MGAVRWIPWRTWSSVGITGARGPARIGGAVGFVRATVINVDSPDLTPRQRNLMDAFVAAWEASAYTPFDWPAVHSNTRIGRRTSLFPSRTKCARSFIAAS
jgi:hypothetical protein